MRRPFMLALVIGVGAAIGLAIVAVPAWFVVSNMQVQREHERAQATAVAFREEQEARARAIAQATADVRARATSTAVTATQVAMLAATATREARSCSDQRRLVVSADLEARRTGFNQGLATDYVAVGTYKNTCNYLLDGVINVAGLAADGTVLYQTTTGVGGYGGVPPGEQGTFRQSLVTRDRPDMASVRATPRLRE